VAGILRLGKLASVLAAVAIVAVPAAGWAATPQGTRLWVGRYEGPGLSDNRAADVVVSPDGSTVYVTGSTEYPSSTGSEPASYFGTVAYNAVTGKRLWVERWLGPGIAAFANSIAVSPDSSKIFVTGLAEIGDPVQGSDIATVAYNAKTGHYLWSRLYSGPVFGAGSANAVTVSPSGSKVFVTGQVWSSTPNTYNLATVAYNAVNGTLLWSKRTAAMPGTSIATSPDGSKVYVGTGNAGGDSIPEVQAGAVAYSAATGRQLWATTYTGPDQLVRCTLAVSQDSPKIFTACTTDRSTAQYLTIGYSAASGQQLWQATYELGSFTSTASAIVAGASSVFVTGTANGHLGTVAYQAGTGHQQWAALYPTPGGTSAAGTSITVSPDGSTVYAAGGANSSYATVAYRAATGARLWGQQWYGVGGGVGYSIAASPNGSSVFVTGVTGFPQGGPGFYGAAYGTVAYKS